MEQQLLTQAENRGPDAMCSGTTTREETKVTVGYRVTNTLWALRCAKPNPAKLAERTAQDCPKLGVFF